MGVISYMGILLIMLGRGQGDLLDYVPTDAYWELKHVQVSADSLMAELATPKGTVDISAELAQLGSDQFAIRQEARQKIEAAGPAAKAQLEEATKSADPEVAGVAKEILAKYAGTSKEREVRRLMAIRTLGERKEKGALAALQGLTTSKEPFVADYAKRATMQIEGKPLAATVDAAKADADVWLFPKDTGILLQENGAMGPNITIGRIAEALPEILLARVQSSKEKFTQQATQTVVELAERVGNVRLETATMGIADSIGPNSGWVMMVGRGKFDPEALGNLLESGMRSMREAPKVSTDGNLKIYQGREWAIVINSDEQVVVVGGPNDNSAKLLEQATAAIKSGKGSLAEGEEISKAINQMDRKNSFLWGVAPKAPAELKRELTRELPLIAAIDLLTATASVKDNVITVSITGQGSDGQAISTSVDAFNTMVSQGVTQMKQAPAQLQEAIKPVIDMLETIKATANETKATVTGNVKVETLEMGLGMLFLELREEDRRMQQRQQGQAETAMPPATEQAN